MAVLNYKTGPWFPDEDRPARGQRSILRRRRRRMARRKAKRAEERLAKKEMCAEGGAHDCVTPDRGQRDGSTPDTDDDATPPRAR